MATDAQAPALELAPHLYAVGREKVREYARAVGESNPVHLDLEAARAAGHPDLVAPPMFAVVYCAAAIEQALFHPELAIDFEMLLHSGQQFEWGPLVHAGDEIATSVTLADVSERIGMTFYVFESASANQHGDLVCSGRWSEVVRPRP